MTLIDKAEALAVVNDYWQSIGGGLPEGPSDEAILGAVDAIAERIAAIPARGVGVKPDRATFDAMCAMRNSINEYIPMPSLESDLLQGPENSVFCATVAQAVIAEVSRLRGIISGTVVKQLEWHNFDAWTHWAEGACGTYHVEERNGYWQVELRVGGLVHGVTDTGDTTPEDLDAAKAAAQADYEARILAALAPTDAPHVNETPKSEHDGADVLTDAAQAREAALQAERDAPDYRLAPDLQRIADRAKTAPHWETENDRLAVPDRKPVWPDFIAPPKYDNPDPRWVDPALPDFRLIWKVSRECGYAVGLHGSMKRDCDLIAVPWTDEAVLAFDLIYRLCEALNAQVLGPVAGKPHGRLGWNLQVDGYVKVIDISVVPRTQDRATPNLKRIGTGLYETQPTPDPAAIREAWEKAYWRMRSYAIHDNDCKLNKPPHFNGPCSCGLTAALEEALALIQKGTTDDRA